VSQPVINDFYLEQETLKFSHLCAFEIMRSWSCINTQNAALSAHEHSNCCQTHISIALSEKNSSTGDYAAARRRRQVRDN
jgi:hypothetical protein